MQLVVTKKMQDGSAEASTDDDFHQNTLQETKFVTIDIADIASRYQDICPLGSGANGLVFSAIDQHCQRRIAVKKITINRSTSAVTLKHLLREICVLRHLEHDNLLKMYHTLVFTKDANSGSPLHFPSAEQTLSQTTLHSIYIGLQLMDTDLQNVLVQQNLSSPYIKLFAYQLLRGVKYIHSANVIHRDLTPSNIFINMDTLMLKIGDFGTCRILDDSYDHHGRLSITSSSTRYQAPEMFFHPRHYGKEIDIWACGCIIAEMMIGQPLFSDQSSYDLINQILDTIPVTSQAWESVTRERCADRKCCPDANQYSLRENGGRPEQPLSIRITDVTHNVIDFLARSLQFDPLNRGSAIDLLNHPYMTAYSQRNDEPGCLRPFHIEDELDEYSIDKYQQFLLREASNIAVNGCNSEVSSSLPSRAASKTSLCGMDSHKNLIALVHSNNQSNGSNHSGVITESEARTIACDFDYGVQITDGSVNRERLCLDFQPIQSSSECFDPYKWDHNGTSGKDYDDKLKAVKSDSIINGHHYTSHSDHGYHSSYCSSNISHSRTHLHSMWSLSSPDVSIDHDHRPGANHNAGFIDAGGIQHPSGANECEESRHSPTLSLDEKTDLNESRRRHKDDAPRHHHSYYHHYHYHHHHHHHHHHHKHHRHNNRHSNSSHQQSLLKSNDGDALPPSSGRCVQRRCVVNEVVPEVTEENASSNKDGVSIKNKRELDDKVNCQRLQKADQKIDSYLAKAPSERSDKFDNADCKLTPQPTELRRSSEKNIILEDLVENSDLQKKKHRSRTMSDGSQLVTDKNKIVSNIQNGLSHFCLGGLFKGNFSSSFNCPAFHLKAQSSDDSSAKRDVDATPVVSRKHSFFTDLSLVPSKCSPSNHPKPSEPQLKQVKCPL